MSAYDFELVDNERSNLSRHSLERLKALAPTFPESSAKRLACVELIAAREQAIAQSEVRTAARRASLALTIAVIALILPFVLLGGWIAFQSLQTRLPLPRKAPPRVQRLAPQPTETPENVEPDTTPEPLPLSLSEAPPPFNASPRRALPTPGAE
jgi:cytochrome c-type biogenesis protein CcmH/NrfG